MSTSGWKALTASQSSAIQPVRRFRLSDVNGMVLAGVALVATIVSTSLSEARYQKDDVERARIEAASKLEAVAKSQYCANRSIAKLQARPTI